MSEPRIDHPSSSELAAFVDGTLPDREQIEAHVDHCAECMRVVAVVQQAELMAAQGLVAGPAADERTRQQERILQFVRRQRSGPRTTGTDQAKVSKPSTKPGTGLLTTLGALGGALGLGEILSGTGPVPALAGADDAGPSDAESSPEPIEHPSDPTHHPGEEKSSADFYHRDVIPGSNKASNQETSQSDAVSDFLERAEAMLDDHRAGSHDQSREAPLVDHEGSDNSLFAEDPTAHDVASSDSGDDATDSHHHGELDFDIIDDAADHSTDDHHPEEHHVDDDANEDPHHDDSHHE